MDNVSIERWVVEAVEESGLAQNAAVLHGPRHPHGGVSVNAAKDAGPRGEHSASGNELVPGRHQVKLLREGDAWLYGNTDTKRPNIMSGLGS